MLKLTKGERLCKSCSVTVPLALQLNNLLLYHPSPSTLLSQINVLSTCGLCETSHISIDAFDLRTASLQNDFLKLHSKNVGTFQPLTFVSRFRRPYTEWTRVRGKKNSPCVRRMSPLPWIYFEMHSQKF